MPTSLRLGFSEVDPGFPLLSLACCQASAVAAGAEVEAVDRLARRVSRFGSPRLGQGVAAAAAAGSAFVPAVQQ